MYLIMCGDDSQCPDPGMICVTCPEVYKSACENLWGATEKGLKISAWPTM